MATITRDGDRLYKLLPALYRQVEEVPPGLLLPPGVGVPQPLRQLLELVTAQANLLEDDIWQLWDNFFIETCDAWVIPYIGELVGNALLHDGGHGVGPDLAHALFTDLVGRDLRPPIAIRTRADVAKTIYYRRRKGTLPMLEELARDVTGWAAHAVAMFEQLEWTQNLEHLGLGSTECPDIHRGDAGDHIDGPFDFGAHAVDVRPIGQYDGWYNIRNIAFFLWRLRSYPLSRVQARQRMGLPWAFTFSPLGNPAPLFTPLRREGDETGLATEHHVPAPLRPAALHDDLVANSTATHGGIYGDPDAFPGCSVVVVPKILGFDVPVPIAHVRCRNLDPWPNAQPTGTHEQDVWVDVRAGRIVFGDRWDVDADTTVSYFYGFAADLGGGPYERGKWLIERNPSPPAISPAVYRVGPGAHLTIGDALLAWQGDGRPSAIVSIAGNARYAEQIDIDLPRGTFLAVEAESGSRPHIIPTGGEVTVTSTIPGAGGAAAFTLSGLLVEGGVAVVGDLARLRILHSTLVPGRVLADDTGFATSTPPSVRAAGTAAIGGARVNTQLRVEVAFSILGPVLVTEHAEGIWLLDSIVDGVRTSPIAARAVALDALESTPVERHWAPPATIERCTILGRAFVARLDLGSNSIFLEPLVVEQRASGCARFSWLAPLSQTPRRHRCQPDSGNEAWLAPSFTALRYGLPGYAQLRLGAPVEIRAGAEDGSEMGVFSHLKQPQRQTNLRIRLDEYLPLGLVPGVVFVT
jgi:hypothetical protein